MCTNALTLHKLKYKHFSFHAVSCIITVGNVAIAS